MNYHPENERVYTRRDFLNRCGMGMGTLGLGALFGSELSASSSSGNPTLAERAPHFKAKAKREAALPTDKVWVTFPAERCCVYADEVLV